MEKDGFKVEKSLLLQSGEISFQTQSFSLFQGLKNLFFLEEQKIIEDYLSKGGGSVLLLLDPQSKSGNEGLLKRWSIETPDSFVIDPLSKLFGGDYAAPVVSQYITHQITRDFVLPTIFPLLRTVKAKS